MSNVRYLTGRRAPVGPDETIPVDRAPKPASVVDVLRAAAGDMIARADNLGDRNLLAEKIAAMRTTVFDELLISPREPGVVAFKGELMRLTMFHLSNHILFGGAEEWRLTPQFYAALVLTYEEREAVASFFLPEQFTL